MYSNVCMNKAKNIHSAIFKVIALLAVGLSVSIAVSGQNRNLRYDYSNNRFGQNQPVPAEESFTVSGNLPDQIHMVELNIYQDSELDEKPIYTSDYRLPDGTTSDDFTIPVNENLKGNDEYTLTISYFREASDAEVDRLYGMVVNSLHSYINLSTEADRNDINLSKHPDLIMQDMNQIVREGLSLYRSKLGNRFPGFSEIVHDKLESIDNLRLRKAKFNIFGPDEDADEREKRIKYYQQKVDELEDLVEREVAQFLGNDFYVLEQIRVISNYKTEKTKNVIPINFGYAAVFDQGDLDNIDNFDDSQYDGSLMVGLSVPLGNPYLSSKFWSNSSISAGVLLNNLDFGPREMTGPLIDRPFYLAYGYKTAYFIRLNAGATVLTEKGGSDKVEFSPFIGISAEINLWLGLSR